MAVGGPAVSVDLIRRVVDSFPQAAAAVSDMRMIVVTGPRIAPSTLPEMKASSTKRTWTSCTGTFAVCDLAIVQGRLTSTMELTASKVPFI